VALDAAECRALLHDDAPAESLRQAAARSLDYLERLPPERVFTVLDRQVTVAELRALLTTASDTGGGEAWSEHLCDQVRIYRAELPDGLLVTGYYEPELPASRARTERFRYPLYRTPDDLVDVDLGQFCPACGGRVAQGRVQDGKLVPYYSRAEIEVGALAGRDYEIAWLDDPVEAFFLHVQGSARLRFDDGVHMQVSFASSNGRPYTSIGRVLVEQGKLSRDVVSLPVLKDYLRAHPAEAPALLAANQRYIFFRAVPTGAVGSLGVPLTAGRSIAADAAVYPPGALVFLRIAPRDVRSAISDRLTFQRFALIQDAGAAISGANRIDVFWGAGAAAEAIAGELRNPGELYLLLPR
jgi:membrane-bound lytic murein transglycosylase A